MNQFQEYLQSIKLVVFDYLCDTLLEELFFTKYIQNENDLFLNNHKI